MKIRSAALVGLLCFQIDIARAQQSQYPTLEEFNNILTACAAGAQISLTGEIRGNFASVYKDKVVDAKGATLITSADFLKSLPEKDRLEGLKVYQACVVGIMRPTNNPPILDTGYERLFELGGEAPGYGLYSYVLIPSVSRSSIALIKEIFKVFPAVNSTGAARSQINILYLPFRKQKRAEFQKTKEADQQNAERYLSSFYDFQLARAILNHLCNPPAPAIQDICAGDRSSGPFIFTYAAPASKTEPIDPPYLLVDLRDVHERAVSEFVAAYQAQIKREDFSDRARLDTLRLTILNITLQASDWTTPISKNLTDIVHSVLSTSGGK